MSQHHPDLEALSAYVDGEAPEWALHVAHCGGCQASAEQLRAVAAAVGTPVVPPSPGHRETAVAAALDDLTGPDSAEGARSARRRPPRRWALLSAAAVMVGVVGFSALVAVGTRPSHRANLAGPALESAPTRDALSQTKADSSAAGSVPPADIGDVPDAAALLARAGPALVEARTASAAAGSAPSAPTSAPGSPRLAAPAVVGTRPCEEQARTREPTLREVVYFAVARRGQVPAVVLGFATGPAPGPVTLVLLAQEGCAELLRAAVP